MKGDRTKEASSAAQSAEAKTGLFAACITLAFMGSALLYTGLTLIGGLIFIAPLPIALCLSILNANRRAKRRREQVAEHRKNRFDWIND